MYLEVVYRVCIKQYIHVYTLFNLCCNPDNIYCHGSQKAVSAYFASEQILPFGFAEQYTSIPPTSSLFQSLRYRQCQKLFCFLGEACESLVWQFDIPLNFLYFFMLSGDYILYCFQWTWWIFNVQHMPSNFEKNDNCKLYCFQLIFNVQHVPNYPGNTQYRHSVILFWPISTK